jgi:hypothetical protein
MGAAPSTDADNAAGHTVNFLSARLTHAARRCGQWPRRCPSPRERHGPRKEGFGRTPAGARMLSGSEGGSGTLSSSEIATSQKSRLDVQGDEPHLPSSLRLRNMGDQAGERQVRMRARSTTGSVAGAASYNTGLATQARTASPSCVLPRAPGPVRLTLVASCSQTSAFRGIFMPLQVGSRSTPDDSLKGHARKRHRKGQDVVSLVRIRRTSRGQCSLGGNGGDGLDLDQELL